MPRRSLLKMDISRHMRVPSHYLHELGSSAARDTSPRGIIVL